MCQLCGHYKLQGMIQKFVFVNENFAHLLGTVAARSILIGTYSICPNNHYNNPRHNAQQGLWYLVYVCVCACVCLSVCLTQIFSALKGRLTNGFGMI